MNRGREIIRKVTGVVKAGHTYVDDKLYARSVIPLKTEDKAFCNREPIQTQRQSKFVKCQNSRYFRVKRPGICFDILAERLPLDGLQKQQGQSPYAVLS